MIHQSWDDVVSTNVVSTNVVSTNVGYHETALSLQYDT